MISTKPAIFLHILIIFIGCLSPVNSLYCQGNKKIDTLIVTASNEIYSNPDRAIKIGKKIVTEFGKNIEAKIRGYILISDAYSSKRDYEKSLEYVIKANRLLSQTNDGILKITVLNKTGIQYHQMKVYEKAIQYLDQAEQLIIAYPDKDSTHIALGTNYIVKGLIYKEKLANDIAIDFFDKGVAELLKSKFRTFNGIISIAKYNKGYCYFSLNNDDLAFQNFTEAFEYAKSVKAKSLQAFSLKGKAQVYTRAGNHLLAIKTLKDAYFYASGVDDLILNREIYKGLSENYSDINNLAGFKLYNAKYLKVKNEINNRERKSVSDSLDEKIKEMEGDFDKKVKNFFLIYSILLFLLIFMASFLIIQFKIRRKKIEQKRKEIQLLLSQNETNQPYST